MLGKALGMCTEPTTISAKQLYNSREHHGHNYTIHQMTHASTSCDFSATFNCQYQLQNVLL